MKWDTIVGNPMVNEGLGAISGGGRGERDGVGPAGGSVNDGEEICIVVGGGEGTNQVHMDVGKGDRWDWNMLRWSMGVAVGFGGLTRQAVATPGSDVFGHAWPDVARGYEAAGGSNSRVG